MNAEPGPRPARLFLSYAREDAPLRAELDKCLVPLKRSKVIECWSDSQIEAGEKWDERIKQALDRADVVLALLSPDFVASDYCVSVELAAAFARRDQGTCELVPIVLRPCDFAAVGLGDLAALPAEARAITLWENQDAAFMSVGVGIREVCERVRRTFAPGPAVEAREAALLAVAPVDDGSELKRRRGEMARLRFVECAKKFAGTVHTAPFAGYLALFEAPAAAVECALELELALAGLVRTRAAVHVGRVREEGANGQLVVTGRGVEQVEKVLSLARVSQVLLTEEAYRHVSSSIVSARGNTQLEWVAHGAFLLGGEEKPVEIYEVGVGGFSKLEPPKGSRSQDMIGGWVPAASREVPDRPGWVLLRSLGRGGFGQVWLGQNRVGAQRVFKFCLQPDRVAALKREALVLQRLRDRLGPRHDIAQLIDWHINEPPYFLEWEYCAEGNLLDWATSHGGLANVALSDRIEIAAKIADALAAAHRVGVLHRDLKPANVLVSWTGLDQPRIWLTDFGLGEFSVAGEHHDSTFAGLSELASSSAGTKLYLAPELINGAEATTASDVFSLGVLLYQLVTGDFAAGVWGFGWVGRVDDAVLKEDIRPCLEFEVEKRESDAAKVARQLRRYDERKKERLRKAKEAEENFRHAVGIFNEQQRRRTRIVKALALNAATAMLLGIGVCLASLKGVHDVGRVLEELVATQYSRLASDAALTVASQLASPYEEVRKLAASPVFADRGLLDDRARLEAALARQFEQVPNGLFASLAIADAQGFVKGRVPTPKSDEVYGKSFTDRDWFEKGLQGGGISTLFNSKADPDLFAVAPVAPFRSSDGKLYLLLGTVKWEELAEFVRPYSGQVDVLVLDENGGPILHPNMAPKHFREHPELFADNGNLSVSWKKAQKAVGAAERAGVGQIRLADPFAPGFWGKRWSGWTGTAFAREPSLPGWTVLVRLPVDHSAARVWKTVWLARYIGVSLGIYSLVNFGFLFMLLRERRRKRRIVPSGFERPLPNASLERSSGARHLAPAERSDAVSGVAS